MKDMKVVREKLTKYINAGIALEGALARYNRLGRPDTHWPKVCLARARVTRDLGALAFACEVSLSDVSQAIIDEMLA